MCEKGEKRREKRERKKKVFVCFGLSVNRLIQSWIECLENEHMDATAGKSGDREEEERQKRKKGYCVMKGSSEQAPEHARNNNQ